MAQVESSNGVNNNCVRTTIENYEFELCYGSIDVKVRCCGKEGVIYHHDFSNYSSIEGVLAVQFGIAGEVLGKIAFRFAEEYDKLKKQFDSQSEIPINMIKRVFVPHDYVDGRPFVTVYYVQQQTTINKRGEERKQKILRWHIYSVDDNGNIIELPSDENNPFWLYYEQVHITKDVMQYDREAISKLNMPSRIVPDVKISDVYKEVLQYVKERISLETEEDYVVVAVWIIASYFYPVFDVFPYIVPYKEGYGSGGTEFLNLLEKLLPRSRKASNVSPASVYHYVSRYRASLLIDEFDEKKSTTETMRLLWGMLASCYHKDATIPRVVTDKVVEYACYGPKAFVDQRLVFSYADIATRSIFVKLKYNPNRDPDVTPKPQDLIDKLYSTFLKYARKVDTVYHTKRSEFGFHGRLGQTLQPLLSIAYVIDEEDSSLNVMQSLRKGLRRTIEYHDAVREVGDPKRRLTNVIKEYIALSLKEVVRNYERGLGFEVPNPWHSMRGKDVPTFYIYTKDLLNEVKNMLMEIYQRDISIKPGPDGKEVFGEREWKRIDDDIEDLLKERTFVAFLIQQFGTNKVSKVRHKRILVLTIDEAKRIIEEVSISEEEIEQEIEKAMEQDSDRPGDGQTGIGDRAPEASNTEAKQETNVEANPEVQKQDQATTGQQDNAGQQSSNMEIGAEQNPATQQASNEDLKRAYEWLKERGKVPASVFQKEFGLAVLKALKLNGMVELTDGGDEVYVVPK